MVIATNSGRAFERGPIGRFTIRPRLIFFYRNQTILSDPKKNLSVAVTRLAKKRRNFTVFVNVFLATVFVNRLRFSGADLGGPKPSRGGALQTTLADETAKNRRSPMGRRGDYIYPHGLPLLKAGWRTGESRCGGLPGRGPVAAKTEGPLRRNPRWNLPYGVRRCAPKPKDGDGRFFSFSMAPPSGPPEMQKSKLQIRSSPRATMGSGRSGRRLYTILGSPSKSLKKKPGIKTERPGASLPARISIFKLSRQGVIPFGGYISARPASPPAPI